MPLTAEDWTHIKWIDKTPDEAPDTLLNSIESDSDSETSVHPPPDFVLEGGNSAAQPNEDDVTIVPINAPEGACPNIPHVELDELLLPLIVLQLLICKILMNLILNIYAKAIKFGNVKLVDYVGPIKSPVPLVLNRFKLDLQDSSIRNQEQQHNHLWNEIGDSILIPCLLCLLPLKIFLQVLSPNSLPLLPMTVDKVASSIKSLLLQSILPS